MAYKLTSLFRILRNHCSTILASLMMAGNLSCAPAGMESFKVNLGIPVSSQKPYSFSEKYFNLTQQIQNPICRQNQVLLIVKDNDNGQVLSTQRVKLITRDNTSGTVSPQITYGYQSADVQTAIDYLTQNSEVEEQPEITKPIGKNASLHLVGAFFNPVNLNNNLNQACDAFDFSNTFEFFSRESPVPNVSLSGGITASGRTGHTATKLANGKILVIGGIITYTDIDGNITKLSTNDVSIYDPDSRTWESAPDLNEDRAYHTATLLPDGRVVVIGGTDYFDQGNGPTFVPLISIEIYNPSGNSWNIADANLTVERYHHTASLIEAGTNSNKILLLGGKDSSSLIETYQIYDPENDSITPSSIFSSEPLILKGLVFHTATTLDDHRILFFGGLGTNNTNGLPFFSKAFFIFDPNYNTFSAPSFINITSIFGRVSHTATKLADGRVLFTGGMKASNFILKDSFIFTPSTGPGTVDSWSVGSNLNQFRSGHTATLLTNGKVLISGGQETAAGSFLNTNEFYENGIFSPAPVTSSPELNFYTSLRDRTATLTGNQVVLIGGNSDATQSYTTVKPEKEVDIYDTRRPATNLSVLSAKSQIDEAAKNSGSIQLNIAVLHGNQQVGPLRTI